MENLKTLLNECNDKYEFVKVCDLEKGKKYVVTRFKYIDAKYGKAIVILDKKFQVIIPKRFSEVFTKELMSLYNQNSKTKFNLIYNGLQNLDNRSAMQLIQFE